MILMKANPGTITFFYYAYLLFQECLAEGDPPFQLPKLLSVLCLSLHFDLALKFSQQLQFLLQLRFQSLALCLLRFIQMRLKEKENIHPPVSYLLMTYGKEDV